MGKSSSGLRRARTDVPRATISAARFWSILAESQLLPADQLPELQLSLQRQGVLPDARHIAQRLTDGGLLTRWQAEQLLAGRETFLLGKYKLLDLLGSGGMGTVYKAEQLRIGRLVAIKLIEPNLLQHPVILQRFQREMRAAAGLQHPNIITAYDADCVDNNHFLVMEYSPGKDLNHWQRHYTQFPIGMACACAVQAALGLQHAFERGMVHRDIKPSNLLVARNPTGGPPLLKILDLGLARITTEVHRDRQLTSTGQIIGTVEYMSPEQAVDSRAADIRADIYSLGVTLFQLLTGRLPFTGPTPLQSLAIRTKCDAPAIRRMRRDIPAALEQVIAKMLARKIADRYQTPAEVAVALLPFCAPEERPQVSDEVNLGGSEAEMSQPQFNAEGHNWAELVAQVNASAQSAHVDPHPAPDPTAQPRPANGARHASSVIKGRRPTRTAPARQTKVARPLQPVGAVPQWVFVVAAIVSAIVAAAAVKFLGG